MDYNRGAYLCSLVILVLIVRFRSDLKPVINLSSERQLAVSIVGASKKAAKLEACKTIMDLLDAKKIKMPEGRGSVSDCHMANP